MSSAPSKSAVWVYNPWLDLIIGCGAWSAPLLLVSYLAANSSALAWSVGFYALALFFNYPHYMATIYRAYHTEEDFRKYKIFTVHITLLVLLTLVLSHYWIKALPWIFTLYLCWSPWHYSGQNFGLFMMFARRAGAKPSANVRQAAYSAFLLSYLVLLISFHTGASNDPLFVSLNIPARASSAVLLLLTVGFVGFSAYAIPQLAKETGWRALLPSLTLFSTQFLWFLLPIALSWAKSLQVPQSRYSTGVLAIMHSAQYLWITSYYARREAAAESRKRWKPLAYFAVLVIGGIALFVPGPWLASRLLHLDFTSSFLIFTSLVNIHHFILDGAIWKLRDGRIASLLLNSQEKVSSRAAEAGSRAAAGLRWLVGASPGARRFRYAAAAVLLTLGIVDQARYYFLLHAENVADLQRAAALNAYDSSLQTRLGITDFESGKAEDAAAAWQKALKLNPADMAARDNLLRYLTSQQRFAEAYNLTRESLKFSPKDADLLVNNGILAKQVGHFEEAADNWRRAIALHPSQPAAHIYLGDELEREDKLQEAIPQYLAFLELVAHATPQTRPPVASVIVAAMRLASCQERSGQAQAAEKSYELARTVAVKAGEKSWESLATIGEARLKAAQNKTDEALALYQHALRLDQTLQDPKAEGADWYSYGMFLRDAGFPARLSYACLTKSEQLLKTLPEAPELKLVSQARESLSKQLTKSGDLNTTLQQALNLQSK